MKRLMLVLMMVLCMTMCARAEELFAPQGSYRVFCVDGHYGVQTLDGETVVPARFDGIEPIQGDMCVVEVIDEDGPAAGLWRLSTGEELLPCEYWEFEITDTMVIVSDTRDPEAGGYFMSQLYDPANRTFIVSESTTHHGIWSLENGRCFSLYKYEANHTEEYLIAPDGTPLLSMWVVECLADSASNGIVAVFSWEGLDGWEPDDGTRYFNTVTGEWLDGFWDSGYAFEDGYAAVWGRDWKWYVIDESGAVQTPGYKWIANEDDAYIGSAYGFGLFSVKKEDGWYIIRVSPESEPKELLGPVECTENPSYLGNGVYSLPVRDGILVFSGLCGQQRLLENTSVYGQFTSDSIIIENNGKYGFLFDDLTVIEPAFEGCLPFIGDCGFVKMDDLWYAIDRKGLVDMNVSYPQMDISRDDSYYVIENAPDDYTCLNADLEPISHVCAGFVIVDN